MARLLICAGGTGGGVYPALVAHQALGSNAEPTLWVGSQGGMEADLVQRAGIPYETIPAGQVAGMGLRTLPNLFKVLQGTLAARRILNRFKPDVLLFTGGYVAVPMALAASGWLGKQVPSLVYVPDIEPGMAIKLLARSASLVALTTEDSQAYFPNQATVVTGYPTRADLTRWTRQDAQAKLGLQPDRFTLLVTGGSSGARSINRALVSALPALLAQNNPALQIMHLTGKLDWEEIQAAQANLPAELSAHYHPLPYLHEMGAALAAADLVIARAGASSLGEFPLFQLPAVLVPYPYAWRYQKVNADYLVQRGAAVMVKDEHLSNELTPTVQRLTRDTQTLQRMREAMKALARPQAAQHLANLVLELAAPTAQSRAETAGNREK